MDIREIDVNGAPAIVNRLTYAGDLGYELWMEPAYQRKIYEGIKAAGAAFGIVDFGMRALLSMRLEKNFPTWFRELRPIYGPFEGGMERWVKMSKPDFIGRAAAARQLEQGGGRLRRVSFVVDALDADVMGDEPIWARQQRITARWTSHMATARRAPTPRQTDPAQPRHRHRAGRLARGGLGDVGRVCALCAEVNGAGLCAEGAGGRRERGGV